MWRNDAQLQFKRPERSQAGPLEVQLNPRDFSLAIVAGRRPGSLS